MPVDSSYNESGYIFMNLDRPFNYGTLTEYICSNVPVHTSFGNLLSNTLVSQKKLSEQKMVKSRSEGSREIQRPVLGIFGGIADQEVKGLI